MKVSPGGMRETGKEEFDGLWTNGSIMLGDNRTQPGIEAGSRRRRRKAMEKGRRKE